MRSSKVTRNILLIAISSFVICYLQFSPDLRPKCDVLSKKPEDIGTHIPLSILYPISIPKHKVDISIGIICTASTHYIAIVKTVLLSISDKLQEMSTLTFKIYIGILSQSNEEQQIVRDFFKELVHPLRIQFITLNNEHLDARVNRSDISLAYRYFHSSFIRRQANVNLLASLLFWTASQESKFFLFADSSLRPNKDFMKSVADALDKFQKDERVLGVKLSHQSGLGILYDTKPMVTLANFINHMSPFMNLMDLIGMFYYFSVAYKEIDGIKGLDSVDTTVDMFKKPNPPAVHSTNMNAIEPFFSSNPYEKGTKFWGKDVKKDSQIALKFTEPILIKSIRIITGLDIYLHDAVTRAVLEESIDSGADNCGSFSKLSDFRSGIIDLALHRTSVKTACLRIRFLTKEDHWVAIQMIEISSS